MVAAIGAPVSQIVPPSVQPPQVATPDENSETREVHGRREHRHGHHVRSESSENGSETGEVRGRRGHRHGHDVRSESSENGSETGEVRGRRGHRHGHQARSAIAASEFGENAPSNLRGQVAAALARVLDLAILLNIQEAASAPAEGGDVAVAEEPAIVPTDGVAAETVVEEAAAAPVETAAAGGEAAAVGDDGAEVAVVAAVAGDDVDEIDDDDEVDEIDDVDGIDGDDHESRRAEQFLAVLEDLGLSEDEAENFFDSLVSFIAQGGDVADLFPAAQVEPDPVVADGTGEPASVTVDAEQPGPAAVI